MRDMTDAAFVVGPSRGGMLKAAAQLCQGLSSRGVSLRWYGPVPEGAGEWSPGLAEDGIEAIHWPRGHLPWRAPPALLRAAARWEKSGCPEVLHAHGLKAAAAVAHMVKHWRSKGNREGRGRRASPRTPAIVVTLHSIPFHDPPGRRLATRLWSYLATGLSQPVRIVCISHFLARWLAERLPALIPRLIVINGALPAVGSGAGAADPMDPAKVREEASASLGLPGSVEGDSLWLVGALSRFSREKGLDVLIEAFHRAASRRDKEGRWRLLLMGDGPDRPRLERRVQRLGLGDKVFFPGFRPNGRELLGAMDVLVMPSRSEGLGLAALEGLAAGVPVIASRAGGLPEAIDYGRCGRLVAPGCPEALADAIGDMWANPQLGRDYVKAGRDHVKRFSPGAVADGYKALYQLVARIGAGPTPQRGW